MFGFGAPLTFLIIVIALIISGIKILKEYERAVVFRLGRMVGARGPGITYIIPGVEKMVKMDLRTVTMDIPPQDVITRDNVSVKVNAVLYFRVIEPSRAVVEVENYLFATSQLAQVTLRSVCGQAELDELLAERERINSRIQEILDQQTDPWGIKVVLVELKYIDLPQEMQRAMAKQAEAERERRAKVIHADGEFQAAQKLADAAWSEAHHKYYVAHSKTTTRPGNVFGLASLLLVSGGWASYTTSSGRCYTTCEAWYPDYRAALRLGPARGPAYRLPNQVYERDFANGTVLVNPSQTTTLPFAPSPGGSYSGSGLTEVSQVNLGPDEGLILLRAN